MPEPSKEPCKKQACDIQACLTKNNFNSQSEMELKANHEMVITQYTYHSHYKCFRVIELLQACCEECKYKSTHCASVSGLLKQIRK